MNFTTCRFAPSPETRNWVCRLSQLFCAFLLGLATVPNTAAQSDDFDDGDDTGWIQYDPLGGLGAGARAMWDFPDGAYRIGALTSPSPAQAGPARAGSVRSDQAYFDFYIAVDVVDWDDNLDQAFGILARLRQVGLGTTDGYAFTYQNGDTDVSISLVTDEEASDLSGSSRDLTLNPDKAYRFVFIGRGSTFIGRIYELPDVKNPIITIEGTDSEYESGLNGLVVYDNSSGGDATADATFDNYLALPTEPPTLSFMFNSFGELFLSWPTEAGPFRLQRSNTLPASLWNDIPENMIQTSGGMHVYVEDASTGNAYFRLVQD